MQTNVVSVAAAAPPVTAAAVAAAAAAVSPQPRYLNREPSLLDSNARVLARAAAPPLPLLERARALHYFAQNLDDFFQIRVAGLKELLEAAPTTESPDGLSPTAQLDAIRRRVDGLCERQEQLFGQELRPELARA